MSCTIGKYINEANINFFAAWSDNSLNSFKALLKNQTPTTNTNTAAKRDKLRSPVMSKAGNTERGIKNRV